MIRLSGVSKTYSGSSKVLDDLHLHLRRGEFLYVLGGTGAGKTTLLRMLATEELPTLGSVSLFGYDLSQVSPDTLRAIRRSIGYVPQTPKLFPDLTVFENIALSLTTAGSRTLAAQQKKKINDLMERFGLFNKSERLCQHLSGGESQRVAVARALIRNPELILADEPTGAQDQEFTWSMMDLFVRANLNGATVLVATHDREIVRRVRKKCAVLKGGHVTLEGGISVY